MPAGVAGFPKGVFFALGVFAQHNAHAPSAQRQNAAGNALVEIAAVFAIRPGSLCSALPALVDLARGHLPRALVNQHRGIGKQSRSVHAGHGRAHQQGRAVLENFSHMIQRLAAARREIIRAKVVSRSHAAQGQFRRHAQLCPGCGGLPHVVKYAFHISGHIACDAVALQKGYFHAALSPMLKVSV